MNPDELRKAADDDGEGVMEAHEMLAALRGKALAAADAWDEEQGRMFDLCVERDALRLRLEAAEKALAKHGYIADWCVNVKEPPLAFTLWHEFRAALKEKYAPTPTG